MTRSLFFLPLFDCSNILFRGGTWGFFRTLCGFFRQLKSPRKSPPQVRLCSWGSDTEEQFALQSSMFSSSFSFWHLLSHCGFTICHPITFEELFLEDATKALWDILLQPARSYNEYCQGFEALNFLRPDLWRVTVEFISIIHLAAQLPVPVMKQILWASPSDTVSNPLFDFYLLPSLLCLEKEGVGLGIIGKKSSSTWSIILAVVTGRREDSNLVCDQVESPHNGFHLLWHRWVPEKQIVWPLLFILALWLL